MARARIGTRMPHGRATTRAAGSWGRRTRTKGRKAASRSEHLRRRSGKCRLDESGCLSSCRRVQPGGYRTDLAVGHSFLPHFVGEDCCRSTFSFGVTRQARQWSPPRSPADAYVYHARGGLRSLPRHSTTVSSSAVFVASACAGVALARAPLLELSVLLAERSQFGGWVASWTAHRCSGKSYGTS